VIKVVVGAGWTIFALPEYLEAGRSISRQVAILGNQDMLSLDGLPDQQAVEWVTVRDAGQLIGTGGFIRIQRDQSQSHLAGHVYQTFRRAAVERQFAQCELERDFPESDRRQVDRMAGVGDHCSCLATELFRSEDGLQEGMCIKQIIHAARNSSSLSLKSFTTEKRARPLSKPSGRLPACAENCA
jgi:hypothetical protein